ncbi:MAG: hypothetical protein ACXABY_04965 [Candidatus Thorarchaeota archaeon]
MGHKCEKCGYKKPAEVKAVLGNVYKFEDRESVRGPIGVTCVHCDGRGEHWIFFWKDCEHCAGQGGILTEYKIC